VPEEGVVLVFNHYSWLDPRPRAASPRQLYFLAKAELHESR
jgi:1-acyl-sn-glycerol-3-phosphate acyltransferase